MVRDRFAPLLPKTPSLSRKRSITTSVESMSTRGEPTAREKKVQPYRNRSYWQQLAEKRSHQKEWPGDGSERGLTDAAKEQLKKLSDLRHEAPKGTAFDEKHFEKTLENLHDRNEAKVIQDISRLLVPSVDWLNSSMAEVQHLNLLTESVNEGWNNSQPLAGPRPQPDYAVGFKIWAFSDKLKPLLGRYLEGATSLFMATPYMCFPFLTCEVKGASEVLEIADRQNAHSMTLAVRAVVSLFKALGHESIVDRQPLAFSVSHDHRSVRIYCHYAVIEEEPSFYRHLIRDISLADAGGKERWTSYHFIMSVYKEWVPKHLERLRSVIDTLPLDMLESNTPDTGPSHNLESHSLSGLDVDLVLGQVQNTPGTSVTGLESSKWSKCRICLEGQRLFARLPFTSCVIVPTLSSRKEYQAL